MYVIQHVRYTICHVLFCVYFTQVPWKSACSCTQKGFARLRSIILQTYRTNKTEGASGGKREVEKQKIWDQDKRECLVGWKPSKGEEMREMKPIAWIASYINTDCVCVCVCVAAVRESREREIWCISTQELRLHRVRVEVCWCRGVAAVDLCLRHMPCNLLTVCGCELAAAII